MRHTSLMFALSVLVGCATAGTTRPADMPQPEASIRQVGSVFFGSGSVAPAYFEVDVTNPGSSPLIVRRVRLESPGMAQWGIQPVERVFNTTIAPGETKMVQINANAITSTSRPSEPLTVRTMIYFEAEGKTFRELYQAQAVLGPY